MGADRFDVSDRRVGFAQGPSLEYRCVACQVRECSQVGLFRLVTPQQCSSVYAAGRVPGVVPVVCGRQDPVAEICDLADWC